MRNPSLSGGDWYCSTRKWWRVAVAIVVVMTAVVAPVAAESGAVAVSPIELLSYCSADVAALCLQDAQMPLSDRDIEDIVHCLNEFGDQQLEPECLNFIVTAKSGACNSDASTICTEYDRPREIVACLRRHENQLSTSCYQSLFDEMEQKYEEEMARRELYYTQSTIVITVISIVYLMLPLVISYWAYKNSKAFTRLYLNTHHMETYNSMHANVVPTDTVVHSAEISFLGISFWVKKKSSTPKSLLQARTAGMSQFINKKDDSHKQILRGISGVFRAKEVTAIMGPTGGGKSTLLRLLGGRMNVGYFHGVRAINGSAMSPIKYDKMLRRQGFVAQFDSLFQELTVWQTMAYGAMLQMSTRLTTLEKMVRAWKLVSELGLREVANSKVGGDSSSASGGVERTEGISGGQRRLLSIGLVLLSQPEVVFADEPTSGLDSLNSLKVIELLHSISRSKHSTVVFSIHQPRPEAFALIDNLVLLSNNGQMVYSGPSSEAASFLSQCPGLTPSTSISQNPADFIIDILGLHSNNEKACQQQVQSGGPISISESNVPIVTNLADHFKQSREHTVLHRYIVAKIDIPNLNSGTSVSESQEVSEPCPTTTASMPFFQGLISGTIFGRSHKDYSVLNVEDEVSIDIDEESPSPGERSKNKAGNYGEIFCLHLWVLFARRIEVLRPTRMDIISFCGQIFAVAVLLSIAFSYDVDTNLEEPYQVIMLIFLLSSYAMMIQYLKIIPEYFVERKIIIAEIANGYINCIPYICSALLTETPRAVIQSIALNGIVYVIRPLNPAFAQISFSFVCLMVGVSAWQSLLCLCCIVSDNINLAYTITFLTLGMGSLFGGLLVKLSNIPVLFRAVYHLSITAVTQRAMIVNDLECCYLSVTCTTLMKDFKREGICPEDFQGGDEGNLGRWALKDLELTDTPILSLLFLFLANIICRCLAVAILHIREKQKYQLKVKEIRVEGTVISRRTDNSNSMSSPIDSPPATVSVEMRSVQRAT